MPHSITSPVTTGPTPFGVPVKTISPFSKVITLLISLNCLGILNKHQLRTILLLRLPIDLQIQLDIMRILQHLLVQRSRQWQERIKSFRDTPRVAFLFGFVLHVAACHVNCEDVLVDSVEPGGRVLVIRKVADCLANHEAEFDFEVEGYSLGTEDGAIAGEEDRGRGFEEEEGLFGALVVQLFYMVGLARSSLGRCGIFI